MYLQGFPGARGGKEPVCQCRRHKDVALIPGLGISPGGGHGNPPQYSCLENPINRGNWQATILRVEKGQTLLKRLSTHTHICLQSCHFTRESV